MYLSPLNFSKFFATLLIFVFFNMIISAGYAATVSVKSPQFSISRFVPHIHYEGAVEQGDLDKLKAVVASIVHCDPECYTQNGSNSAIVTLNSPGGNYIEGLRIAAYFRDRGIATLVQSNATCYSACAFAFLGGSGFSTQDGIGQYIDRTISPGGIVGFHAPYLGDENIRAFVESNGISAVQNNNRDMIALMVQQLVSWNVNPRVMDEMVSMGPNETWDANTPERLFFLNASLPKANGGLMTDVATGVRSACLRLIAEHLKDKPSIFEDQLTYEMSNTGTTANGAELVGFRFDAKPLGVSHCSIPKAMLTNDMEMDIALYSDGIQGAVSMLSFFNRPKGWSTLGAGGRTTNRIFQKGSMDHYFLPPLDDLANYKQKISISTLFDGFQGIASFGGLEKLELPTKLAPDFTGVNNRVSNIGNLVIYETTGSAAFIKLAFENLFKIKAKVDYESGGENGFVRAGTYDADGNRFSWIGLVKDFSGALIRIEVKGNGTEADLALIRHIECNAKFDGVSLKCG